VCVYCASSPRHPELLDLARRVGEAIARRGWTLVSGGGKVSAMGALAGGAPAGGGGEPHLAATARPTEAVMSLATATSLGVANSATVTLSTTTGSVTLPLSIGDVADGAVSGNGGGDGLTQRIVRGDHRPVEAITRKDALGEVGENGDF